MLHQDKNEYGYITIDETFITQLIIDTVKTFNGNVWLANYKGKQNDLFIKLGDFDALSQIDISETEKGIYIKIYIVTKFGQSISQISNTLIDILTKAINDDLELPIDDIIIELTGVVSSKGIGKRNHTYSYNEKHQRN